MIIERGGGPPGARTAGSRWLQGFEGPTVTRGAARDFGKETEDLLGVLGLACTQCGWYAVGK